MNPIFQAMMISVTARAKKCPKCGRMQVVRAGTGSMITECRFCGAKILPNKSYITKPDRALRTTGIATRKK